MLAHEPKRPGRSPHPRIECVLPAILYEHLSRSQEVFLRFFEETPATQGLKVSLCYETLWQRLARQKATPALGRMFLFDAP
jgi:hypothetical protein